MGQSTSHKGRKGTRLRRRDVLRGAAAISAAAILRPVVAAAQSSEAYAHLPSRGEYLIRGAYVITMDDKLGDVPAGDIHVKNGAIVAVGKALKAPGAKVIDGKTMIAMPGLIETHWHMWGTAASNTAGDTDKMGYFSFAKAGVPAMLVSSGLDLRNGGRAAGERAASDYTAHRYHTPNDVFNPAWDLSGILEDTQALYELGQQLSDSTTWPQWNADSPFRAARERMSRHAGAVQ